MKKIKILEDCIEDKIFTNLNLLEIAKNYCEFNNEKSDVIVTLGFLIDIILNNQQDIFEKITDIH